MHHSLPHAGEDSEKNRGGGPTMVNSPGFPQCVPEGAVGAPDPLGLDRSTAVSNYGNGHKRNPAGQEISAADEAV